MRVLHTADWHIGQYKGPMVQGENARMKDIEKCLDTMAENASALKPDLTIISGDIFISPGAPFSLASRTPPVIISLIRSTFC